MILLSQQTLNILGVGSGSKTLFSSTVEITKLEEFITVTTMTNSVVTFDGIDDSVELSKGFPSIDKAITIEFWAKGENSLTQQTSVIEAHNAQKDRVLNIHFPWQHVANSRIFWDAGNENGYNRIDKEVKLEEYNGWTHWAFVKDTATGKMFIYRNGEIWHQGEGNLKSLSGINKFVIGSFVNGGHYWKGSLREFRIWNTGRTQAEIKHSINSRLVGNESGLVGYWPLNEGSGAIAKDRTTNANHGTIKGNPSWQPSTLSLDATPSQPENKEIPMAKTKKTASTNTVTDNTVKFGDTFYLKHMSDRYLVAIDRGSYNYPQLGNTGKVALQLVGGREGEAVNSQSRIKIRTTESVAANNDILGAFSSRNCYYWQDGYDENKQSWTIANVSGKPGPILYDDPVYLTNCSYINQNLIADTSNPGYITTAKNVGDWWILESTVSLSSSAQESSSPPTASSNVQSQSPTAPPNVAPSPPASTVQSAAVIEYALTFDGQDDFITCPEGIVTNSYTKEAWVKLAEPLAQYNNILSGHDHALFMPNGGCLASGHNNQWELVKDSSISPVNTWLHVAVTYDSQTKMMCLYRDGNLVSQASNVPPFNPSDRILLIGSHHTVSLFKGQMAEARVWNKVLSQTEIQSNLSHRLVGNEPGLVGYWPLNDGEGAIAHDKTSNAHHGTINGNPSWQPSTLSLVDATPSQPENKEVPNSPGTLTQESPPTTTEISPAVNLPTDSKIKLKSWKGDYLHRPDSPQGVTTWNTGVGNEWTVEAIADNKIKLKSWKGDYLHRPDSPPDVTTWSTGVGNEWTVEAIADNKIKLKSWKGDYLHRPDSPPDVTTWNTGIGNEWELEVIGIPEQLTSTSNTEMGNQGGVKFGTAVLQFDGQTNYIEIPHQSVLGLTNNFTVEAWFNAQTLEGYRRMFSKFPGFGYGLVGSSLLFTTYWIQDYATAAQLTAGTWYHLAIVFDASNSVYFYLNGELLKTVAGESPATLAAGVLEIGRKAEGHGEYWHGQLAELRLWNRAKTAAEIQAGKSCRLVGDEPNLVGYWPLNEGVGTTIQDKTSNANHGSIRGNNVFWGLSTLELAAAELKGAPGTSSQAIEEQAQPSAPEGKEQIPSIPEAKVPSQGETVAKLETPLAPIIIEMEPLSDEAVLEFFTKGNGPIYDSVDSALDQMKAQGAFARNAVPVFIVISGSVLGG